MGPFGIAKTNLPDPVLIGKDRCGQVRHFTRGNRAPDDIEVVGRGFSPAPRPQYATTFPPATPVLPFMDTRGLAEAGYDASEDIKACEGKQPCAGHRHACRRPGTSELRRRGQAEVKKSAKIRNCRCWYTPPIELLDYPEKQRDASCNNQDCRRGYLGDID